MSAGSRVLLAGAFGQRNPGDDALLEAFARALDDREVVATSSAPLTGRSTVPSGDPQAVMREVRAADAVVLAGGTVFKALPPATRRPPLDLLARALALVFGARALGKPVALVGVGAGALPGRRARLLARRLVRQADLLVLRDEESAGVLAAAGAPAPFRIGADPAWTLLDDGRAGGRSGVGGWPSRDGFASPAVASPAPDRFARPARGRDVVVALSHDAGGADLADDLAASLVPVLASGLPVVLQPWQIGRVGTRDDLDLARAVNARLGGTARLAVPPEDLRAARDELAASSRLVVGLRFHSLVAAAAAGVPFVAYAHEPKLAGLARRLRQPAVAPGADPAALGAAIVAAARDGAPAPPAALRREVAAAEEGFRLLRLVLSDGRAEDEGATIGTLPLSPTEWAA